MSKSTIIILVAVGSLAFIIMVIGLLWFYKLKFKNFGNRNSETGSSDPSAIVEWNRSGQSSGTAAPISEQGVRLFTMEELEKVTNHFNESSLLGYGGFGPVYKGLLCDGTVVAVKRRSGAPRKEFVTQVAFLSEIRHRNLVTLLGYCQESGSQILVFEYLPNGSIRNHLYDSILHPSSKLEFKQRLSIAIGAGRGLCHLHSLKPPLVHKNFKTANVLVDEDFIAKVADAGISNLTEKMEESGPSHTSRINVFQDPELGASDPTEAGDVYSFGVFLLELVTGQEAVYVDSFRSNESLFHWVESRLNTNDFVDSRLLGSYTKEGITNLIMLFLQCMSFPSKRRPKMETVVLELERIKEKEMALTTVMGEGTANITLGSELFTS